jgi:hypothetical protein
MPEPVLKFSVTCPDCALESVSDLPIALIANALLTGKGIRLHSDCHDRYWTATFTEREQVRESLRALNVTEPPVRPPCLHRHHPTAQGIKKSDHRDPDQINPRQAEPVRLRVEPVGGEKLLCRESL